MNLDDTDHKILEILKDDARTPFTEVGRDLGVSDATVHVRVKSMIDSGVIRGFTVEVDERTLGENIHGFVFIDVNPGSLVEVAKLLIDNKNVSEVYEVHGSNDLVVKIKADDLEEMRNLILNIRETPNIIASEMIPIFKKWK
jgi:Lrp/AsnC family transcriptional regulator for asnA, asnC and gidA